ncbi:MAG: hypothetical protein KatS3mg110_2876 [Pirellulaceae bacterium]|nr:MAG: hypothetical protein KatS3mg110_2876 [Pirellulaceae bacterium]
MDGQVLLRRLVVSHLGILLAVLCCSACRTAQKVPAPHVAGRLLPRPSHNRHWQPALAVLPWAEIDHDTVRIHNIRNCYWFDEQSYVPRYYDRKFRLEDLRTVDFIVVPFREAPSLAHTMLSFGFADGTHLGVSVEARLEVGENYSPWRGALNQYELIYVVADEKDLILLRTEHRKVDVYLYRTKVQPEQVRQLFVDIMQRVNKLYDHPEFYHTLYNNCTTNIVQHVNRIRPGRIPVSWEMLLTGHSDRLAFELGLIEGGSSFEETRRSARINEVAHRYRDRPDFSQQIRR